MTTLSARHAQAFEDRGISAETAARFGIFTGERREGGEVVPAPGGNIVVFPFLERGAVVAEKYRAPGKTFSQKKGGRQIFWNVDVLDDPALVSGHAALVITEGEMDALTAIDCGFPFTVSVPAGAPAVTDGEDPERLPDEAPQDEPKGKFAFVWHARERLKPIKRFILAVDNDAPGIRLRAELQRRLSPSRCWFVTYPEGCKDLNEVRLKHGAEAVARVLNEAKQVPVKGVYKLSDYPEQPRLETYRTGLVDLDDALGLWLGELLVVTGVPGHGKSSLMLEITTRLIERYGWVCGVASFEIPIKPQLRDKLRGVRLRMNPWQATDAERGQADRWIEAHWTFITSLPTDDDEMNLDWLMEKATDAVLRDGIKILLVDPWNEIEHGRRPSETQAEYIGRALRSLRRLAQAYELLVIVVAHPTKDFALKGTTRPLTLYDIDGGAMWVNKPDHGIIVDVPDPDTNETIVHVKKVRFRGTGKRGAQVKLRYVPAFEGYEDAEDVR